MPSNVRLPALFTIGAGGRLTPPVVSGPAGVTIELTVTDRDTRSHVVKVAGPAPVTLTVAPGGSVTRLLTGLPKGSTAITVDGVARGSLQVGAAPGP